MRFKLRFVFWILIFLSKMLDKRLKCDEFYFHARRLRYDLENGYDKLFVDDAKSVVDRMFDVFKLKMLNDEMF